MLLNRLNFSRFLFSFTKKNASAKSGSTFDSFASDLNNNKDVYQQYQKQVEKDSILKKFRRDVFKKEELSEQVKAYNEQAEKQSHMMEDMLHRGSKEDIMKYSKKIMEKLMNRKKVFKDQTINPVFSDYGDYSSYRSNFLRVEDGNLGELQRLDQDKSYQNVYNFIDSLPEQFEEKDRIRQQIKEDFKRTNESMSISDYGKIIQQRAEIEEHSTVGKQLAYETYKEGRQRIFRTMTKWFKDKEKTIDRRNDLTNRRRYTAGRLSPQAMDTIYECYLQGWTVRDISKRFGILPERTKFCIWARAQLYDEFLPKYGWKYYYDALETELSIGEQYGYVDYGLDLDVIYSSRMPESITEWNPYRLDAQRKEEEYTLALQKLEKMQKFDRHQKMEVGTHGKQNKMYLLKEWTIFRGKGSDQHHLRNNTFRQLSKAQKKMVKEYY